MKRRRETSPKDWVERAKKKAAIKAVSHIRDGYVVGLGSGTTVAYAVEHIGRRVRREGIKVTCIPTSYQIGILAAQNGIPITTLYEHPKPDLAIDGADQIDGGLNMIKGGGGALTMEKIVDSSAKRVIIVVDESKLTDGLGRGQPVPIEVLPFALPTVLKAIRSMGGSGEVRMGRGKVGPVITDNGNIIVDADFGVIKSPKELEEELNNTPGVVENGLFIQLVTIAYVGTKRSDVIKLKTQKKG